LKKIEAFFILFLVLPINAFSGAVGTPQETGGGGGFGISIDLGTLLKVVKSVVSDKRYQSPDTKNLAKYEPHQLILCWDIANQNQVMEFIKANAFNVQNNIQLPALGLGIGTMTFSSDDKANQALKSLKLSNHHVTSLTVSRHAIAYPMAINEVATLPSKQYARDLLKVTAGGLPKLTSNMNIGIIDTEITNANVLSTSSFQSKRMFLAAEKPAAADHGNAVAAIISGAQDNFNGLAQGVSLRAAAVMREVSPGINATNTLLIAQALDWLVSEKVQVANLSLGSAPDDVLSQVVSKSQEKGMIIVAAAGNGGAAAPPSYPAAYPNVVAVTAVDEHKHTYARANHGAYIAIAAPGVDIWAPISADGATGKYMSGTSFASPFVTAAIARELANKGNPANTIPQDYVKVLCAKAENLGSTVNELGCGLLQL
jgi:subtilisin family serine protease